MMRPAEWWAAYDAHMDVHSTPSKETGPEHRRKATPAEIAAAQRNLRRIRAKERRQQALEAEAAAS